MNKYEIIRRGYRKKRVQENQTLALADRAETDMLSGVTRPSDEQVIEARRYCIENKR